MKPFVRCARCGNGAHPYISGDVGNIDADGAMAVGWTWCGGFEPDWLALEDRLQELAERISSSTKGEQSK